MRPSVHVTLLKPVVALSLLSVGVATTLEAPPIATVDGDDYSNIAFEDYVGPQVCAECHPGNFEKWSKHPHSRMNRPADASTVMGDFDDRSVAYAGGRAEFTNESDEYFMTVTAPDGVVRRYRVDTTVGSRVTQMYVGRQISGPEPRADLVYWRDVKLPFAYWFSRDEWLPESYFDTDFPVEYDNKGRVIFDPFSPGTRTRWDRNCIFCHNTYPYELRMLPGENPSEVVELKGFPWDDLAFNANAITAGARRHELRLEKDDLVTMGISCESCHFGGREHAIEGKEIRFVPTSPHLEFPAATPEVVAGARENPYVVNSICAQCHSAKVNPYPNGAGRWNSREAADMIGGACASEIRCTDCHDPHEAGPPDGALDVDDPAHIAACTVCHDSYAESDAAREHSRHGAEVNCLDCHMPRIVQGLTDVVRTHRISSPTSVQMLRSAEPNACNLCHLDKSVTWTRDELAKGWGVHILLRKRWAKHYRGSLDNGVGEVWLNHRDAVVRLIATDAYSRSPLGRQSLTGLWNRLNDRVAVNRMFGLSAIERILGIRLTQDQYSPMALPSTRAKQTEALKKQFAQNARSGTRRR